jgi:hypothetical protein
LLAGPSSVAVVDQSASRLSDVDEPLLRTRRDEEPVFADGHNGITAMRRCANNVVDLSNGAY